VAQDEAQGDHGTPDASDAEKGASAGLWVRLGRWWRGGG
jgi:hypothetical protein